MRISGRLLRGWLPAAVGLAIMVALASPGLARAHAILLRAMPSSSQMLSTAPDQVRLLFSEPLDPVFSGVRVLNSVGQSVDIGDSHVDPNNDHELVASLQPNLPAGIYT